DRGVEREVEEALRERGRGVERAERLSRAGAARRYGAREGHGANGRGWARGGQAACARKRPRATHARRGRWNGSDDGRQREPPADAVAVRPLVREDSVSDDDPRDDEESLPRERLSPRLQRSWLLTSFTPRMDSAMRSARNLSSRSSTSP